MISNSKKLLIRNGKINEVVAEREVSEDE